MLRWDHQEYKHKDLNTVHSKPKIPSHYNKLITKKHKARLNVCKHQAKKPHWLKFTNASYNNVFEYERPEPIFIF